LKNKKDDFKQIVAIVQGQQSHSSIKIFDGWDRTWKTNARVFYLKKPQKGIHKTKLGKSVENPQNHPILFAVLRIRIRDPDTFWTPGSWIRNRFFQIPDPNPIHLRA
jgi:hypothetical protein